MVAEQRGYIGLGTTLEYDYGNGNGYVEIARLSEIGEIPLTGDADDVEVTGYDTPTRMREFIKGLEDPGDMECTGIFTAHESQLGIMESDDVHDWRLTLPDGLGSYIIPAYAHSFMLNPQLEDRIEFSFTLRVAGQVVPDNGNGDGDGTELVPPTGLSVSNETETTLDTTWDSVSVADSYTVRHRVDGSGPGGWSESSPVSGTEHTIEDLDSDTTYEVAVASNDGQSQSDFSDSVTGTTLDEL